MTNKVYEYYRTDKRRTRDSYQLVRTFQDTAEGVAELIAFLKSECGNGVSMSHYAKGQNQPPVTGAQAAKKVDRFFDRIHTLSKPKNPVDPREAISRNWSKYNSAALGGFLRPVIDSEPCCLLWAERCDEEMAWSNAD